MFINYFKTCLNLFKCVLRSSDMTMCVYIRYDVHEKSFFYVYILTMEMSIGITAQCLSVKLIEGFSKK